MHWRLTEQEIKFPRTFDNQTRSLLGYITINASGIKLYFSLDIYIHSVNSLEFKSLRYFKALVMMQRTLLELKKAKVYRGYKDFS